MKIDQVIADFIQQYWTDERGRYITSIGQSQASFFDPEATDPGVPCIGVEVRRELPPHLALPEVFQNIRVYKKVEPVDVIPLSNAG